MVPHLEAFELEQSHEGSSDSHDSDESDEDGQFTLFKGYCGEYSDDQRQLESPYRPDLDPQTIATREYLELVSPFSE